MNNSNKCTCMSNDKFDRISSLPDEMLQHILSFLGIREAVQTSLVSKRWVKLWTFLSRLNFDPLEVFSWDEYLLGTEGRKRALDAKFKEFVETLLSRREVSFLDTFMIEILDRNNCFDLVRTCVSYAMKFNPRVFSLEASCLYKDTSACIFSCKSIEELCLRTSSKNSPQEIPEVVDLPFIRRLELKRARLDNKCITSLFSGCPKLEELSLDHCSGDFSCIFSQKLKFLSLHYCLLFDSENFMIIRYSCLRDAVKSVCPFHVVFLWKTVSTSITAMANPFSFIQNLFRCLELDDYFGGISDVTLLKLYEHNMMYFLETTLPKLGVFHNLIGLCLGAWCMTCNFSPVALFLQKTPNLQKISLYMCSTHCRGEETGIHQMVDNLMWVYLSGCKNLKQVEIFLVIDYIRAHKIDVALLPSRKQLENVEIIISSTFDFSPYVLEGIN